MSFAVFVHDISNKSALGDKSVYKRFNVVKIATAIVAHINDNAAAKPEIVYDCIHIAFAYAIRK